VGFAITPLLLGDLRPQLLHVLFDPRPFALLARPRQLPLGIRQPKLQLPQHTLGTRQPNKMLAQLRQACVEPGGEINELARREPKWQLGVRIESQRYDRLLVLQCPCPFGLAP